MSPPAPTLRSVDPSLRERAVFVLRESFHDDPTLRWCFAAEEPGYADRLQAYLEAGHDWHTAIGQPVQGAFLGDELVGVLYGMDPDPPESEDEGQRFRRRMEEGCGPAGAERFFAYNQAVEALAPEGPAHVLALVGVLGAHRRRGIGGALVGWLGERCDADPRSRGVVLDTGAERNLAFYARHGYRVVGEQAFGALVERVLFRPRRGAPG